jgi:hexosaminidase
MQKILLIISIVIITSFNFLGQDGFLPLVPNPQKIFFLEDKFSINDSAVLVKYSFKDTSGISISINEIKGAFQNVRGIKINSEKNYNRLIWFGLPDDDKKFERICIENRIWSNNKSDSLINKIGKQGYSLIIKKDSILIAGNTKAGVYYGIQTLKQLLRGNREGQFIQGVKIIDWPDLKYRGILDDISRGPVPTMEFMKQQIRRLAELKMNTLQYYTENVVLTKSHPEFAPPDGSISIGEWKELAEYARKYHIILIGNFQSFGHFEKILANPKYSHLGERGNLLSPAFSESIQFLKDIYSEMVPAFNSPFFNVNADETFDLGKGASKSMVENLGMAEVYTDQIKKMHDILKNLNVRMMMWTDILLKYPESLTMLPKDIIMMTWGYDPRDSYADMIEPIKRAGFDFTISPGVLNSSGTMPDYSQTMPNIHGLVKDGINYGTMGMVCTVWDDGGSAMFSRDWYGVAYSADQSWNSTGYNLEEFDKRFNNAVYGDPAGSLTKTIWELTKLADLTATGGMKEKLLWTKVIPDSSELIRFGINDWDKVIEISDSAENDLFNGSPFIYKSDYDYFELTIKQYRYFAKLRFNLLKCTGLYEEAFKFQDVDKGLARNIIVEVQKILENTKEIAVNLCDNFSNLWLRENKTYFLDSILVKYNDQVIALKDIENRILSALRNLDSRKSIPNAASVRLNIKESEGKYFTDWMMTNPISVSSNENDSVDYLKSMGGELNAIPKVTQEFTFNNKTYRWRRTSSEYFDVVDLNREFPGENRNSVTYAFANIDSPDDRIAQAFLGSTGGVEVIINGIEVYDVTRTRKLKYDEDTFKLPLKKGRNNLMLKLIQKSGEWKFTFRLRVNEITNSKNRYKIMK